MANRGRPVVPFDWHGYDYDAPARASYNELRLTPRTEVRQTALETKVGYLGAMGSRKTNADRRVRLEEAGADASALDQRLMAPIGLDIGARTPEETAVAIMAEVIALRAGRVAQSLRDSTGPIHRAPPVPAAG